MDEAFGNLEKLGAPHQLDSFLGDGFIAEISENWMVDRGGY